MAQELLLLSPLRSLTDLAALPRGESSTDSHDRAASRLTADGLSRMIMSGVS